jgi:peptidoglycan/xylan/chitin deacetylase (PgdA/CDA1 family)
MKYFCLFLVGLLALPVARAAESIAFELSEGGMVRGPKNEKRIALVFTAHTFAEGGDKILDELAKHHGKASFFVTGDFLDNTKIQKFTRRMVKEGHYLGPHSDKHLLYCPWDGPKKTLVTREEFETDLNRNVDKITRLGVPRSQIKYWLPAYEWYNRDIVDWSKAMGLTLVNYTPGTRSNADYLADDAKNFISSRAILDSIEKKEQTDPHGLNGFLLLMHLGVGPARTDKLSDHFGELLDYLEGKGYQFVRVDELLKPSGSEKQTECQ